MGRTDRVSRGVDVSIVVGQQGLYVSFVRRVSPSVGIYLVLPVGLLTCMFSTFQTNQPSEQCIPIATGNVFPRFVFFVRR